jgi:CCR4-NOT complex subunit CAF16
LPTTALTIQTVAGKSTLLQILAGKRLVTAPNADLRINGQDVFRNTPVGLTFLGTEWFVLAVA